jgi:hypothetical protein
MKKLQLALLGFLLLFASGCAQGIKYSVKDVPNLSGTRFADQDLVVSQFKDDREYQPEQKKRSGLAPRLIEPAVKLKHVVGFVN